MRFLGHLLLAMAVALVVGFGLSWVALTDGRFFGATRIGPWVTWRDAGLPNPDPYTRAHIGRSASFELGVSEGLQFIASTDSDNRTLDRSCRYRIDGATPTATLWTLVPVDEAFTAITRPDGLHALTSTSVARDTDGSLQLYVSKSLSPRNWLEIVGEGPFSLVLTLYDVAAFSSPSTTSLPAIIREDC